jgi:hypothetical protein
MPTDSQDIDIAHCSRSSFSSQKKKKTNSANMTKVLRKIITVLISYHVTAAAAVADNSRMLIRVDTTEGTGFNDMDYWEQCNGDAACIEAAQTKDRNMLIGVSCAVFVVIVAAAFGLRWHCKRKRQGPTRRARHVMAVEPGHDMTRADTETTLAASDVDKESNKLAVPM